MPESLLADVATWDDFITYIARRNLEAKAQKQDEQKEHMKNLQRAASMQIKKEAGQPEQEAPVVNVN